MGKCFNLTFFVVKAEEAPKTAKKPAKAPAAKKAEKPAAKKPAAKKAEAPAPAPKKRAPRKPKNLTVEDVAAKVAKKIAKAAATQIGPSG